MAINGVRMPPNRNSREYQIRHTIREPNNNWEDLMSDAINEEEVSVYDWPNPSINSSFLRGMRDSLRDHLRGYNGPTPTWITHDYSRSRDSQSVFAPYILPVSTESSLSTSPDSPSEPTFSVDIESTPNSSITLNRGSQTIQGNVEDLDINILNSFWALRDSSQPQTTSHRHIIADSLGAVRDNDQRANTSRDHRIIDYNTLLLPPRQEHCDSLLHNAEQLESDVQTIRERLRLLNVELSSSILRGVVTEQARELSSSINASDVASYMTNTIISSNKNNINCINVIYSNTVISDSTVLDDGLDLPIDYNRKVNR